MIAKLIKIQSEWFQHRVSFICEINFIEEFVHQQSIVETNEGVDVVTIQILNPIVVVHSEAQPVIVEICKDKRQVNPFVNTWITHMLKRREIRVLR